MRKKIEKELQPVIEFGFLSRAIEDVDLEELSRFVSSHMPGCSMTDKSILHVYVRRKSGRLFIKVLLKRHRPDFFWRSRCAQECAMQITTAPTVR